MHAGSGRLPRRSVKQWKAAERTLCTEGAWGWGTGTGCTATINMYCLCPIFRARTKKSSAKPNKLIVGACNMASHHSID